MPRIPLVDAFARARPSSPRASVRSVRSTLLGTLSIFAIATGAAAQDAAPQEIDNLVHPPGTECCEYGALEPQIQLGAGPVPMVLLTSGGFGAEIFRPWMEANVEHYTMTAFSLPGYGGTKPMLMPPAGTSYAEQTWCSAVRDGLVRWIDQEGVEPPILVGHHLSAGPLVLRFAMEFPELVRGVVVIAGEARRFQQDLPPDALARTIDEQMAVQWFQTVTPETWANGMFPAPMYCADADRAQHFWELALTGPIPTAVRYFCETWAVDVTRELSELSVPTLVVIPGFDDEFLAEEGMGQMAKSFYQDSWEPVRAMAGPIQFTTLEGVRLVPWEDDGEALSARIAGFIDQLDG